MCMGTACFVKRADGLLAVIEAFAGVKAGETTPDKKLSLLTARCIGACGIAPAVVYDEDDGRPADAGDAVVRLKGWLSDGLA